MDIFWSLDDFLFEFYWQEMQYIEPQAWHFKSISKAMSTYICEFLCSPNHNYRIECAFEDGTNLFTNQSWIFDIHYTYEQIKQGIDTLELQSFDGSGFTCDICRCETSRYDWMYHCVAEHSHDYCASCIYSIISQYKEMKEFLNECLDDLLLNEDSVDKYLIDNIVAFCVGKVSKFEITS